MCDKHDISEEAERDYHIELTNNLLILAEKELAAFISAVEELFGPHQARQSAFDWIEELELSDWPTEESIPDLRQATLGASARLGASMSAMPPVVTEGSGSEEGDSVSTAAQFGMIGIG